MPRVDTTHAKLVNAYVVSKRINFSPESTIYGFKVRGPYVITLLNWAPIFEQ